MGNKVHSNVDETKNSDFSIQEVWIMDYNNNMNYKSLLYTISSVCIALKKRGVLQPRYILCHIYPSCKILNSIKNKYSIINIQVGEQDRDVYKFMLSLYECSKSYHRENVNGGLLMITRGHILKKNKITKIQDDENCIIGESFNAEIRYNHISGTIIKYNSLDEMMHSFREHPKSIVSNEHISTYLYNISPFERRSLVIRPGTVIL